MENKDKRFTLKIRGQEIEVSEEVYRAYIRPVQAEQRRKRRVWKCRLVSDEGKNGKRHYVRCQDRCETCPYYLSGGNTLGNTFSLDKLIDGGAEMRALAVDTESDYIEQETLREEYARLREAIRQLRPRQREMIRMIYFGGVSQEDAANKLGIAQASVSITLNRAIENLKKIMKK